MLLLVLPLVLELVVPDGLTVVLLSDGLVVVVLLCLTDEALDSLPEVVLCPLTDEALPDELLVVADDLVPLLSTL
ncbi:hypothetical protein D0T84_17275 [Dysgonomonas sp. 521]|nr:hypothetical protein [Dysgonomonas sp. 521]